MRDAIETAPKNQDPIIIEDEVTGTSETVSWSSTGTCWMKENGEPAGITPTHWRPVPFYQRAQGCAPTTDSGSDRVRLDYLVAQVSRRSDLPTQRSRRPRRWVFLAFAAVTGSAVFAAYLYLGPHWFVQQSTARVAEWRAIYEQTVASLFEREGRNSSHLSTTQPSTVSEVTAEQSSVEDGIGRPNPLLAMVSDLQRQRQEIGELKAQLSATHLELGLATAQPEVTKREVDQLNKTIETSRSQLRQEREKTDALTNELAAAQRDLKTKSDELGQSKKNVESTTAELRRTQEKAAVLSTELSNTWRDLERFSSGASRANEETSYLKKANDSVSLDLQRERQKATAMAKDAAETRQKYERVVKAQEEAAEAQKAATKVAAELQAERQKSAALEGRLDAARRDAEAQIARTKEAPSPTISERQAPPANAPTALPTSSISSSPARAAGNGEARTDLTINSPQRATIDSEATRLVARANSLILQGNITEARIVLDRAAQMGSAQASFAIAETYDPHILSNWKTVGTRPDVAAAREFYSRALAGGILQAKSRLDSLR